MNNKQTDEWEKQNWPKIQENTLWFQRQIYECTKRKDEAGARHWQFQMINFLDVKFYAVKKVTSNKGGKTPGVDDFVAVSSDDKFRIAYQLSLDGNTDFIRRVYIPKPGTKEKRPLGIPTIIDRCKQCLCKLALEPQFEAKFEGNSFGFRPKRSAIDAVAKIRGHLIFKGRCYVLDTDIRKCFDRIDHQVLRNKINAIEVIDKQIAAWLKAGILDKGETIFPTEGTPQGGIISPLLANIALDGLQKFISQEVKRKYSYDIAMHIYFVRYADDFVVMAPSLSVIEYCKVICEVYLKSLNLEMKSEVTKIVYTGRNSENQFSNHFEFLGFRFIQREISKHIKYSEKSQQIKTLVLVSPKRIQRHKASIKSLLKQIGDVITLIDLLNPRITGWCTYFRHSDSKIYGDLPRKMDIWLNTEIRKWIRRTTKIRGKQEVTWKKDTEDWILYYKDDKGTERTLNKYSSHEWSIRNYKAVNTDFNPYT